LVLSYQWVFEKTNIAGATIRFLLSPTCKSVNEGAYRVVIQNPAGSLTSSVALVRVIPAAPLSSRTRFRRLYRRGPTWSSEFGRWHQPIAYQWVYNGKLISGMTSAQYSIANIQASNAGNYQVSVSNSLAVCDQRCSCLSVTPSAPYFVTQPLGSGVACGNELDVDWAGGWFRTHHLPLAS